MKDKTIIYFSVFLSTLLTIVTILLVSTFIETGSFEIKADSIATAITLILSVIVIIMDIAIVQIQGYRQIAMIKSIEENKFISYEDLNDLQLNLNLYRSIINSLSQSQWNKVCEKYHKLKQQEERAKEQREYSKEYYVEIQTKINKIMEKCDD